MDPSLSVCISYDSLTQPAPQIKLDSLPPWYTNPGLQVPGKTSFVLASKDIPVFVDVGRYQYLTSIKDKFNHKDFGKARNITNPLERLSKSIFMNRAALKLANVDALYGLTRNLQEPYSLTNMQPENELTYCDLAGGPGSFSEYLQYRYPNSYGTGITLKGKEGLDWQVDNLDLTRFDITYGGDGTGNLYSNWEFFISDTLAKVKDGMDVVVADGGFELDSEFNRQEFLSSHLILNEILVAVSVLKKGGNLMVKVFDTVTLFSAQLLYLLSLCFERITIFKPAASRPANSERYVIGWSRRDNVSQVIKLLTQAANSYSGNNLLTKLFDEELPGDFRTWLVNSNNYSIEQQIKVGEQILAVLQGQRVTVTKYNLSKFLIVWSLPDTLKENRKVQ